MKKFLLLFALLLSSIDAAYCQVINQCEYFFDRDPGVGQAMPLTLTLSDSVVINQAITTTGLSIGFHNLSVRFKGRNGIWGLSSSRTCYILSLQNSNFHITPRIAAAEYFFNQDPGLGLAEPLSTARLDSITINPAIILPSNLPTGFNKLCIRFKDESNKWSSIQTRVFYIVPTSIVNNQSAPLITQAEYFYNSDPGIGQATPLIIANSDSVVLNPTILLPNNLPFGFNKLCIRFKNQNNKWSSTQSRDFYLLSTPQSLNHSSPLITKAEYFIYNDPGAGSASMIPIGIIADSVTLITGISLPSTLQLGRHIMSIRFKDSSGTWGLASSKPFNVNLPVTRPSVSAQGLTQFCSGATVVLRSSSRNLNVWSTGDTTQNITVSRSGNYTCRLLRSAGSLDTSSNSDTIIINVLPTPVRPTISGRLSFCQNESTTLTSSATRGNLWSNGDTTQTIIVSSLGSYSVRVVLGGCTSGTSNVSVVTVTSSPITPIITQNGNALIATSGDSLYRWFRTGFPFQETTNNTLPGVIGGTSYRVIGRLNGCWSDTSAAYTVLGVNQKTASNLKIYPSPATSQFTVEVTNPTTLQVLNAFGQVVITQKVSGITDLNTASLPSGMYTVLAEGYKASSLVISK